MNCVYAVPCPCAQAENLRVLQASRGTSWNVRAVLLCVTLLPFLEIIMTSATKMWLWHRLCHYDGTTPRWQCLGGYMDSTGGVFRDYSASAGVPLLPVRASPPASLSRIANE